jgi:hypothetical protein
MGMFTHKKLWIGKETTTEDIINQVRKYSHCRKQQFCLNHGMMGSTVK